MKRFFRWLRDAWLIFGITLLLVLCVDGLLKAWLPDNADVGPVVANATPPARSEAEFFVGRDWVDALFREFRQVRHTVWTPYVYWRRQAVTGTHINIDDQGRRATWQPPTPVDYILWVFGGSTIWGSGARDGHTVPSAIARELHRRGHPTEVVNYGESGYVSTQELILLMRELQSGRQPDGVIFYDGVNDVFAALQAGQAGLPQNESQRQADFRASYGLDNWLAVFPHTLEGVQRLTGSNTPRPAVAPLAQAIAQTWHSNVQLVQALAEAYDFDAWFFWQPSLFAKPQRSAFEEAVYAASAAYHRDLQLATDAAIQGWQEPAADVFDFSALFASESSALYMDFCHLSELGNARVASAIVAAILPVLAGDRQASARDNHRLSTPP